MELTSLPTESLYKFTAFAGLVIIFATTAYAYKFLTAIGKKIIELTTESEVQSLRHDKFLKESERSVEHLKNKAIALISPDLERMKRVLDGIEGKGPISPIETEPADTHKLIDEVYARWKTIDGDGLEIGVLATQLKGKLTLLEFETRQERILKLGCSVAIITGVSLAYYGFSHWVEMQGYIDQALINESLKKAK